MPDYTLLLRDSKTLTSQAELAFYKDAKWRRHVTEPGDFEILLHLEQIGAIADVARNRLVEIRRDGVYEFAGVIRKFHYEAHSKNIRIGGPDLKGFWLSSREIDPGASEFDSQSGVAAETAMKHYVDDHLVAPSAAARNVNNELTGITFLTQGDSLRGTSVEYSGRWVNLLTALIDLARSGDVLQDVIIRSDYGGYEYQVSSPVDATEDTGAIPVVFSIGWDNVSSLIYKEDFSAAVNALSVLGTGSGAARVVQEVLDAASIAADFRREGHLDSRQADTVAKLTQAGRIAIAQSLFDAISADAEPLLVGPTLYRNQWDIGYDVTLAIPELNVEIDRRIVEVQIRLDEQEGEKMEICIASSQLGLVRSLSQALAKANPSQVA